MFKYSLSALAGVVLVGVCCTTAKAFSDIPDIEIGGITYEIDFKSSFFNTSNLDPDLLALLEAQPWFTGIFSGYSLALDAASQVYDCGGFLESSCSIPFDEFGSVNPFFGGTSPYFIYDNPFTQVTAAAVGFPNIGGNTLKIPRNGGGTSLYYAVATPKNVQDVPEPASVFGLLAIGVLGFGSVLKKKLRPCNKI
jgi:hypothetical protein